MNRQSLQEKHATNQLITRKEAAAYLGTKENTLSVWACNKRYDLPLVKVGRLVKYRISDLDAFIERSVINGRTHDGPL